MNKSPKLLKNRGTEKTGINSQGKASIVHSAPVGGSPVARLWRLMRLTSWLLFQELREAEAVLAIVRTELRMDAYTVLLQACQRQDGVTKQKNTSNYFSTALLNKRTRPITLQRRY